MSTNSRAQGDVVVASAEVVTCFVVGSSVVGSCVVIRVAIRSENPWNEHEKERNGVRSNETSKKSFFFVSKISVKNSFFIDILIIFLKTLKDFDSSL